MEFSWSERKRAANIKAHGIDFVDAARVFEGLTFTQDGSLWASTAANPDTAPKGFWKLDLQNPDKRPDHFTHIRPRRNNHPAKLSEFLAGDNTGEDFWLSDPAGQNVQRPFGDLRRRAADLHDLVNYGWFYELHRLPLQFVH